MRYVTVRKFSNESGYTEAAIRSKISEGVWVKEQVWRRAPDGRVLIDVHGYEAWVESGKPSAIKGRALGPESKPVSPTHQRSYFGSPPPLI